MKLENATLRALSALLLGATAGIAWVLLVALFAGDDPAREGHQPTRTAVWIAGGGALLLLPAVGGVVFRALTPRAEPPRD